MVSSSPSGPFAHLPTHALWVGQRATLYPTLLHTPSGRRGSYNPGGPHLLPPPSQLPGPIISPVLNERSFSILNEKPWVRPSRSLPIAPLLPHPFSGLGPSFPLKSRPPLPFHPPASPSPSTSLHDGLLHTQGYLSSPAWYGPFFVSPSTSVSYLLLLSGMVPSSPHHPPPWGGGCGFLFLLFWTIPPSHPKWST